jgi:dTDP-4-dehydrorhamnose reductase
MRILILGAGGMLGSELTRVLSDQDLIVADLPEWDITQAENLKLKIEKCQPELIINCAAFTNVEEAESPKKLAFKVNAEGPLFLAEISQELNIPLVHLSTDYVFDGKKKGGYNEDDLTNPVNFYGVSKATGERNIMENCQKYYLVRTSWLFGQNRSGSQTKKNFIEIMLDLAQSQKPFAVVTDQYSKPTYAWDLAQAIKNLIFNKPPYGIYHLTNEGSASWYEYAQEIFHFKNIHIGLNKTTAAEFFSKAKRPIDSSLNNNKLPKLRLWQEALEEYLRSKI